MSSHAATPSDADHGQSRIRPHHLAIALGLGIALFTAASGIVPVITDWHNENAIHREVFGDIPYKTGATRTYGERVRTITTNLVWHQNGAGGALPANRVDGGLWKYGSQEGNGPAGSLLVSFWQTPFVIEPMVRAYVLTDSADIAAFIRRSGNALKFSAKSYTPAQRSYFTGVAENPPSTRCLHSSLCGTASPPSAKRLVGTICSGRLPTTTSEFPPSPSNGMTRVTSAWLSLLSRSFTSRPPP